jgi:6-phosphogluconolactonase
VYELRILESGRKVADEAAEFFIRSAGAIKGRPFRIALSGGSTPKKLYERLAGADCADRVEWPRLEFYFGDERCVPADDPESNFKLANDTLFRPLGINAAQVFRMEGESGQPDLAARRYEEVIRHQFTSPSPAWPRFDLIFLGLGDDGHTASLFPGTASLGERTHAVVASESPRGVAHRISFTPPLINHARRIIFMAAGVEKAPAVRAVLEDDTADAHRYPAKLIRPVEGRLIWYLDKAAASGLAATIQDSNSMRNT